MRSILTSNERATCWRERDLGAHEAAFETLLERMTPWLLDLGNWIFGALIAFSLVIKPLLLIILRYQEHQSRGRFSLDDARVRTVRRISP